MAGPHLGRSRSATQRFAVVVREAGFTSKWTGFVNTSRVCGPDPVPFDSSLGFDHHCLNHCPHDVIFQRLCRQRPFEFNDGHYAIVETKLKLMFKAQNMQRQIRGQSS
jgi:hypothetical protein